MLPKKRRLTTAEVREVLAKGRSMRGKYLSARYLRSTEALRCGVVVSKKVARRAVERNRLRRAVYRALQNASGKGSLIFFVQKIPSPPLQSTFAEDILQLTRAL